MLSKRPTGPNASYPQVNHAYYYQGFFYRNVVNFTEKDRLLEIHLLKKTARHQNLDCSTLFEQMSKK
jgi:hypothetical protein